MKKLLLIAIALIAVDTINASPKMFSNDIVVFQPPAERSCLMRPQSSTTAWKFNRATGECIAYNPQA